MLKNWLKILAAEIHMINISTNIAVFSKLSLNKHSPPPLYCIIKMQNPQLIYIMQIAFNIKIIIY